MDRLKLITNKKKNVKIINVISNYWLFQTIIQKYKNNNLKYKYFGNKSIIFYIQFLTIIYIIIIKCLININFKCFKF